MIAALFVLPDGPYANREGVDAWPESRDARLYAGPWPVVAHPPCQRWGRYWSGGPSATYRRELGDDGGCFAAAYAAVCRWGGVIEHPEGSHAWRRFGIRTPLRGGWVPGDLVGGWTCCVEQGHYGHRARKATWLYVRGVALTDLPELPWGKSAATDRMDCGFPSTAARRAAAAAGTLKKAKLGSPRELKLTPPAFAELLISIAERAQPTKAAA